MCQNCVATWDRAAHCDDYSMLPASHELSFQSALTIYRYRSVNAPGPMCPWRSGKPILGPTCTEIPMEWTLLPLSIVQNFGLLFLVENGRIKGRSSHAA